MIHYDNYIDALKQKDEEAFSIVYHNTKHAVYATILAITRNHTVCEDLMQETYITMLEKIHQYQLGRNFMTWLLIIARHKAIDYYRQKQKTLLIDLQEDETLFPISPPQGEHSVLIEDVLRHLSEIERSVLLLHIVQNCTFNEISKIVDMALGTVLWHYRKAIQKIKKMNGGDLDASSPKDETD